MTEHGLPGRPGGPFSFARQDEDYAISADTFGALDALARVGK
jgi:hypothetical protein